MLTLHSSNLSTVGKRSRLSSEACRASVASRGRLAARDRMLVAQAQPLRVAIVGGGICGPTLAALMARELRDPSVLAGGVDVHLFEQRDAGGGISLAPNGMRVLSRLGLTEALTGQAGEELLDFNLLDSAGETIVSFKQRARERYGHPAAGFRRYRLRAALLEAARREPGVTLHSGHRLVSLDCGESAASTAAARPATLVFENGASFTADLVVGCDGIRSRVRAAVRGAGEPPPRYTGTEEVICVTRARNEDLVARSGLNLILGSGPRQFGTYGVGSECMWFASRRGRCALGVPAMRVPPATLDDRRPESRDSWGAIKTPQEQEAVRQELLEEFKGWTLVEQLVQRDVDIMMRVGIYDRPAVSDWVRGVVTLAGDAASPIPPNLGQGGNKALEDAGVLVGCMKRCGATCRQLCSSTSGCGCHEPLRSWETRVRAERCQAWTAPSSSPCATRCCEPSSASPVACRWGGYGHMTRKGWCERLGCSTRPV
eukprot:XP_001693035.1 flavoprotein monooxygenase [Chlamydomonas reinhardtii]